ncbi:MAG: TlyA family RNA methyltransferase [Clostridiales bacterium]|jgi:23S rRNA (cytidine1920-2'-O)/16S rRNA (cytidine1409-2'-O)-methyltransferase|nr:TlyA family RNA methyltransferase [Clostridiales bacterium]
MTVRLDVELVKRNFYQSRERAQKAVESGMVSVNGKLVKKVSYNIKLTDEIKTLGDPIGYVSRGGLKLKKGLEYWNINLLGLNVLDVGASTGGFTQCMLEAGAESVFAVDVGHGQLATGLLENPKVINMEGTDIRGLRTSDFPFLFDFASIDVSFISLEKVLPEVKNFLKPEAGLICLIKPQFELDRRALNRRGLVRDPKLQILALEKVCSFAVQCGYAEIGHIDSPILGGDGNKEYLLFLKYWLQ